MKKSEKMLEYLNRLRVFVAPHDMVAAVSLIEEINKETNGEARNFDDRMLYSALLHVSDKLRIVNPFGNERKFVNAYRTLSGMRIEPDEWEFLLMFTLKDNRHQVLPAALTKIFEEHFNRSTETVLIAEGEKFVPNLQKIVDNHINCRFTITCSDEVSISVVRKIFADYENVEVVMTDIYRYEFVNKRFDLILASPAFGGRMLVDYPENSAFMCREYDMVALENLSFHLNSDGEMVIILPGRITFASGRIASLRRFIQETYTIKELAELPEGIFEFTGIKTYLLNIQNARPEDNDITIRRYAVGERRNRRAAVEELFVEDDTFVMLEELENQGDWNIDKIFAQQDDEWMQFQNSDIRKEQLENVAEVFRGKAVNKSNSGNIGVINISNIGEYEIDFEGLNYIKEEERRIANYILQDGDVILPARGTAIRTAVFEEQSFPCIAHSNVIIIRPNPKMLDSTYLKVFFDSPLGNKQISGAQQGMTVMNISYKDLKALEIPLPTIEEQKEIAELYNKELKLYKETILAAEKRWNEVVTKLQKF